MLCAKRAAIVVGAVLALGLLSAACTDEPAAPLASAVRPNLDKLQNLGPQILSSQRIPLQDGIVHYTYDVAVGTGQYDVIRLHRVVRESRPDKPVATADAVFLLPGANTFEQIFMEPLISQAVAWDHSIAVYLAQNDIDVWGADYSWGLVAANVTDFDFMEGWGLQWDVDQAETALSVARSIRASTGQGFGRLHLLGYSYGGMVAYSLVGQETQLPPGQRNVKSLVGLGAIFKLENESERAFYCDAVVDAQAAFDAGVYSDDSGLLSRSVGEFAVSAPDDASPVIEGFTNLQVALLLGARTELLTGRSWHFVGGSLDENGIPTGLLYTDTRLWLDVLRAAVPHSPMRSTVDESVLLCGNVDVPFDDHLAEIAVPILQVAAAGGLAPSAYHAATLTASKDITNVNVQLQSDADRVIDFGHGDLLLARDADELVWRPILDWLLAHRSNRTYPVAGKR
ncbi:MAG: hypothetical protein P8099_15930 [Gemmatimonadota bacterium]|jgi:pimeloyl-ACP methyl ester carboxylesterase